MGGKRKGSRKAERSAAAEGDLIDLLAGAQVAVELALDSMEAEGPQTSMSGLGLDLGEPCGPALHHGDAWAPIVDPLLLDRYRGLLVRSGMVGGRVHHLPSRLREQTDTALRQLIVGVARDRAVSGARVDALVEELLVLIGERIAGRVEEWHPAAD
ncbi:MAG: hypothetical protein U0869_00115 [Chloroflexota bacterium]